MNLSVIIPTCNRPDDLRRCLDRLVPQVRFDAGEEVIVTDDGITEEARQVVETFPDVRWTQGPRRGPAANRNHGASLATGEWLVFLDDDCLPESGWLEGYKAAIQEGESTSTALEGRTVRESEPPSLLWEAPHVPIGGALISCNFAIRKDGFDRVGRFDERYPVAAFEDTEFAARHALSGGRVRFVREAAVIHPLRRVPSARKLAARWEGKVIFALDQGAPPAVVMFWLPWHVFRVIGSRFRARRFRREHWAAVLRFAGELAWVCWRTPGWVAKHRKVARSAFWVRHVHERGPVSRFGF